MTRTQTIRPAPGLAIDADYFAAGTWAMLAKRGAGKSYASRVLAEEMWRAHVPFVLFDPMGVCWGLRSSADGESDGIPVAIFGGKHGDAPLERTSGRLMADLVMNEGLSMVLDMSEFGSHAAEREFAHAFLDRLYFHNERLVHLLIDEADLFSPQKPSKGAEGLLGVMDNIVRRGRNRGIGVTLMTQRPAVLNKDVLTQVDGLIAMRIVGLPDREAVDHWVKGHGEDPEVAGEVKGSLAGLANGESWWWVPELGILKRVQIRKTRTFDSSPSRKRGELQRQPKGFADVDMTAIEGQIAATVERAKADDPKALRAELAALKRELAKPNETASAEDLGAAYERGRMAGDAAARGRFAFYGPRAVDLQGAARSVAEQSASLLEAATALRADVERAASEAPAKVQTPAPRRSVPVAPTPPLQPAASGNGAGHRPSPAAEGVALSRAERRILTVLAQYPDGRTKRQLAMLTGYSASGGGFNNALSSLRTAERIDRGEPIRATHAGIEALGGEWEPLPTGRALLDYWLGQVGKAERLVLEALARVYPGEMSKDELADATGYAASGGGFNNALSRLRTLELIDGRGAMRLDATLGDALGAPA